jgi:hypothetical protein
VPEAVSCSVAWALSFVARFQHPRAAPVELGEKVTVRVCDAPAATVNAALGEIVTNADVLLSHVLSDVTLRGALPELVRVAVLLALLPVATVPRSSAVGDRLADGADAEPTVKLGSATVT